MLSYKEFYIWLDGYMTNRTWTKGDIEEIQIKMKEVKDNVDQPIIRRYDQIPVPVNPMIRTVEPSWDITCKNEK